jgi:hypothetical protein
MKSKKSGELPKRGRGLTLILFVQVRKLRFREIR